MSRHALIALPLTVAALLLGACGDDDEEGAPGGEPTEESLPTGEETAGPDPCTLLDDAAVEDAIGTAAEGKRDTQFGLDQCAWEGVNGEVGESPAALYVTLGDADAYANYENPEVTAKPVEGLGEEAILLQGSARATGGGTAGFSVVVRTADRTVVVAWSRGGAPGQTEPTEDEIVALTERVLEGL